MSDFDEYCLRVHGSVIEASHVGYSRAFQAWTAWKGYKKLLDKRPNRGTVECTPNGEIHELLDKP